MSRVLSREWGPAWVRRLVARFRFLNQSLTLFAQGVVRIQEKGEYACESRYRLRLGRYWFANSEIEAQSLRLGRPITVLDLGCERGFARIFCPPDSRARWIGLDRNLSRLQFSSTGYEAVIRCDFDRGLPVADECADAVVCLHVLEHLPHPEALMSEIARTLKSEGVLIAATPVLPGLLATVRERQLRRKIRRGARKAGRHYNAFTGKRWKNLLGTANLKVEAMSGSHFLRSDRNPLENQGWWIRLNQLWGILFPSLGREIFVLSRKSGPEETTIASGTPVGAFDRNRWTWAKGLATLSIGMLCFLHALDSDFENLIEDHHDASDVYYIHSEIVGLFEEAGRHSSFTRQEEIESILRRDERIGKQSHFVVPSEKLPILSSNPASEFLRIVNRMRVEDREVVLLSIEGTEPIFRQKAMRGSHPLV